MLPVINLTATFIIPVYLIICLLWCQSQLTNCAFTHCNSSLLLASYVAFACRLNATTTCIRMNGVLNASAKYSRDRMHADTFFELSLTQTCCDADTRSDARLELFSFRLLIKIKVRGTYVCT